MRFSVTLWIIYLFSIPSWNSRSNGHDRDRRIGVAKAKTTDHMCPYGKIAIYDSDSRRERWMDGGGGGWGSFFRQLLLLLSSPGDQRSDQEISALFNWLTDRHSWIASSLEWSGVEWVDAYREVSRIKYEAKPSTIQLMICPQHNNKTGILTSCEVCEFILLLQESSGRVEFVSFALLSIYTNNNNNVELLFSMHRWLIFGHLINLMMNK